MKIVESFIRCANQNVQVCKKMHASSRLDRPGLDDDHDDVGQNFLLQSWSRSHPNVRGKFCRNC